MRNLLPRATELDFKPFPYSDDYPEINCCSCNRKVPAMGGFKADIPLGDGFEQPLTLIVCSKECQVALQGVKAGTTTAFIIREAGRLRRMFPQDKLR
jgi:hypothetical protein